MKRYTIFQIYAGDEDFLRDQKVRDDEHGKFIVVDDVKSYVELSDVANGNTGPTK